MNREHRRRRKVAIPWGLLGMLGLVLAAESWLTRHDRAYRAVTPALYRFAGQMAEREAPKSEVLGFGDSLLKFGFVPGVIAERTGKSTYNLAIVGGQPPATYAALRRALDAGAKPSAILFDCKANILSTDIYQNLHNVSDLFRFSDALEMAWTARDASLFASVALDRALLSVRRRDEVRSAVRAALRGEPASPWTKVGPLLRNAIVNRGAFINPRNNFDGHLPPESSKVYLPETWTPDRINTIYLRRFLTLARSRGIPVYWILPPIAPEVQALRVRQGLDEKYLRFVRRMLRRFPEVVVIDGRDSGYDHSLFIDPSHLNGEGAAAFSAGVAEVLRLDLAGPDRDRRWVALPPYRPAPIALENIDQSKLIIGRADDRRRR